MATFQFSEIRNTVLPVLIQVFDPSGQIYQRAVQHASNLSFDDKDVILVHELAKPVQAVFKDLAPFDKGCVVRLPDGGGVGFDYREVGERLCYQVRAGKTPDQALDWVEKILSTQEAAGYAIMALRGIKVESEIDLGNGVRLIPFSNLPESGHKRQLSESADPAGDVASRGSMIPDPPECALIFDHTVKHFIHFFADGKLPNESSALAFCSLLDDTRLALTLCGPSAPMNASYWFQYCDPEIQAAIMYPSRSLALNEIVPSYYSAPVITDSMANGIACAFQDLEDTEANGNLKSKVRLSLTRLNQAVRRPLHGDRVLDLAIALESLLVGDGGGLSFKFALRGALLTAPSIEDRRTVRATLRAFYELRSELIHKGTLGSEVKVKGIGKVPSAKVVTDTTSICAQVIRKILELKSVPNWDEYELAVGVLAQQ
ncbi:hypothetical protein HYR69_10145 [Candidatus Sumerlaeota bacterium]|nr:hypothetical protein [Candidatus Sumerlaeota bacterium]MBI3736658.1 hypothetical protein [Candidatus Sumerlaeota bacterium]